ncbi:MAG TPA: hypothetical protein VJN18_35880 [Polyangiaceae bacterium]|nr:hypothetical protein [Polyangiaceae bacterium]
MTAKAMDSIALVGDGTSNTPTATAELTTTARISALPAGFSGNWIRVKMVGAAGRWVCRVVAQGGAAPAASDLIDNTQALTGTSLTFNTKIGSHVSDGETVERELPSIPSGATLYFAWQGLAAGTFIQIEKGSGKPGSVSES